MIPKINYVQQLGHNSCACNLDKNNVVETDAVEGVQESKTTLDFVGLDHTLEDIADLQWLALTGKVISDGEDGTEVVRGVTPLGCQEAVIEVQPTDLGTNVEGTTDRVKLVVGSRNPCT